MSLNLFQALYGIPKPPLLKLEPKTEKRLLEEPDPLDN